MEEIIIDIELGGQVRIEGKNIEGPDCKKLTAEIEAEIGDVEKTTIKPEYHRKRVIGRKVGA